MRNTAMGVCMVVLACVSSTALAETAWAKAHPRRAQVNERLIHQQHRITQQVKEGELTHAQALELRHDDHAIRAEERALAAQQGGHITKAQQRALNHQENQVSRAIGK